jgi:DsbC/DsbD-like thiol-disulfide interchange protein
MVSASAERMIPLQKMLILLAVLASLPAAVALARTSDWVALEQARLRLIDGGVEDGRWLVGVQIDLAPGWKSYWRVPGESGVPPVFDWSASTNLKEARVLFPAPARLHDEGGEAIGYQGEVIFPVEVEASDPARPVGLKLELNFAVCQAICIPAQATLAATPAADQTDPADRQLLRAWLAKVPAAKGGGLEVKSAALEPAGEGEGYRLVVQLDGTNGTPADIFVEGDPDLYFGAPKPLDAARYALPVLGLKEPDALVGKTLTLTVVAGARSVVRSVKVR